MPRKLKAFVTSAGFFDLAVAAPSMKAALAAWGAESDLFHQGFARETRDPAIVEATLAQPGVVLRRPVGTAAQFKETAEISERILVDHARTAAKTKRQTPSRREGETSRRPVAPARKAAAGDHERQEKRRLAQKKREEEAWAQERERSAKAVAAAEAALRDAEAEHERRLKELDEEKASLDHRASFEEKAWTREKERLREALRRARQ